MLNEDYKEMLQILLEENVKFIVVGAYALGAHGYPRATGDIDIWVEPSTENAQRVIRTLSRFGAPLFNISEKDFEKEGIIFKIGVAPRRIDIITTIDGVEFQPAYSRKDGKSILQGYFDFYQEESLDDAEYIPVVKVIIDGLGNGEEWRRDVLK